MSYFSRLESEHRILQNEEFRMLQQRQCEENRERKDTTQRALRNELKLVTFLYKDVFEKHADKPTVVLLGKIIKREMALKKAQYITESGTLTALGVDRIIQYVTRKKPSN